MSEQAAAPAGWYPDSTQGQERYWDGSAWTDQLRPAAPAAPSAPAPRTPSAFGGAIRGYWRGTTALLRGDALGAYAATGGSALASWILPIAKHSIVFAFLFLGYLGWLFGLPAALIGDYLQTLSGVIPGVGAAQLGMATGFIGQMFHPAAAGGVLAGAFFVGLGLALLFFALRALLVVALGRLQGARIGYVEALRVVGTAHLLTPYPFAVAALLCIIPGMYGGTLAAIVFAIGGVAATTVSETAIALRVRELSGAPAAGASGVIQAAAFGGATLVVVGVLTYWFGSLLVTAGFQAIFGGLVNTLSTLGGLGGMGGLGGTLG